MTAAPAFEYTAIDRAGATLRGVARAPSTADAYRQLAASGLTPVSIRPARRPRAPRIGRRISPADVAHFTYQFSVLISARIPISDGILSIAEQEQSPRFRAVLTDLAARIQSGERVADAMDAHRDVFGDVHVKTIRVAEQTGSMAAVLEQLCDMLERSQETASRVRSALVYPACVLAVLALGVAFLITFVIPTFSRMFKGRGIELPTLTRALVAVGDSVQTCWWAYLAAAVAAALAARWAWRDPSARLALDAAFHRVPLLRAILRALAIARFARVLGVSLASGLGLIDSLTLAGDASGRPSLARDARLMVEQVRSGGRLCDVLISCRYMTPFARRMLTAGEDAGQLPRMCSAVARHYDRESAYLTKNIVTVIEPVMVVAVAAIVLVVALAIFLPMWDMVKLVG